MSDIFDLIVIGAGPGGYVAAIRAAQLGLKTVCVDKGRGLGGTCLNVGCIPSKALLHSTHLLEMARRDLAGHGVLCGTVGVDLNVMMARKDRIVAQLTGGIEFLFKKNKIAWIQGRATVTAPGQVSVVDEQGGARTLAAKNILLAPGSLPAQLPGFAFDGEHIISSTEALALKEVPPRLAIIGAGVIGLELGSVWRRLGSQVTVIEFTDGVLPGMDGDLRKQAARVFMKQGLQLRLSTRAESVVVTPEGVVLSLRPAVGDGAAVALEVDRVLVAVGRVPQTRNLGLEGVGIALDARGFIPVDDHYRTVVPGILAIGDCIGGPMLAHKAEEEGVCAVERLVGQGGHVRWENIPGVVYTDPEIAAVGRTEEGLQRDGIAYRVGKFPFSANSRARAVDQVEGFVKILADAASDRILGVHIIGPQAGDLIAEMVLVLESDLAAEDVARTCHAHPSLAEAVKEAALAVDRRAIHI
ncbi:MAG: dihydrolipoyl dehydrogenase [Nitrospirae bacterium]|nr:dihydrolipoyl dehydrogenase [Magnetococcales bacterium]HAT51057.1 dihydrolipoyl dehydrogenase [Alphaproteobacteria bacterium]